MRVMVLVKASPESEAGVMPTEELLAAMGKYNEELVEAGIMLAGEGLHPSSKGARVRFDAEGSASVIDGPFAETKELVAGYWIVEGGSKEEAIEWFTRCPNTTGEDWEVEIRPFYGPEDFPDELTPELREAVERLEATGAEQHG